MIETSSTDKLTFQNDSGPILPKIGPKLSTETLHHRAVQSWVGLDRNHPTDKAVEGRIGSVLSILKRSNLGPDWTETAE